MECVAWTESSTWHNRAAMNMIIAHHETPILFSWGSWWQTGGIQCHPGDAPGNQTLKNTS